MLSKKAILKVSFFIYIPSHIHTLQTQMDSDKFYNNLQQHIFDLMKKEKVNNKIPGSFFNAKYLLTIKRPTGQYQQ